MKYLLLSIVIISLVGFFFVNAYAVGHIIEDCYRYDDYGRCDAWNEIDPSKETAKAVGYIIVIIIIVIIVAVVVKLVRKPSSKMSKRYSYRVYGKENRKPNPIRQKSVEKKEISAFCENCGKPLKPTAKFCGKCGTPRT